MGMTFTGHNRLNMENRIMVSENKYIAIDDCDVQNVKMYIIYLYIYI